MRRLLVVMALAACAPHSGSGPSWPKASSTAKDGGESLSPRETRQVTAAIETSEEDAKPVAAALVVPPAPPSDVVAPVVAPSVSQPIEDTITTEDIIIEVDE